MSKYKKGLALFNQLHGEHSGEEIVNQFKGICPKMAELTIETIFGDIMQNKSLDLKCRGIGIISALVALGNAVPQLRAHTEAAFSVGATQEEIRELILQLAISVGFPAAANAMIALKDLLI